MILKKIYSINKNDSLEKLNEKKVLSKHLYNKFVARSYLLGNSNFSVLDNNSNFYNISTTDLEKLNFYFKDKPTGSSLNLNLFSYKNKFNSSIQFKSFNFNNKIDSFSSTKAFNNLLEVVSNESSNSLLFLNPVKGGFNCYSSGVVGFLPRKQGDHLISLALTSLKKNNKKNVVFSNLNYLLSKNSFIKTFFSIKLPHWWGRTGAYFYFSDQKLVTRLSFIFLSQKVFNLSKTSKKF